MTLSTRERLIESAGELFARRGFNPVGLDQIIDDVGVTKTTLYKYFASKDELIIAVLGDQHTRQMNELLADLDRRAGADPRSQVLAIFDVFHDWFATPEFRGCFFLNAATEFPMETDPIHIAAVAHGKALEEFIHDRCVALGARAEEAWSIASQICVLLTGAIVTRQTAKRQDAALIAKRTAEVLLPGA